MRLETGIYQPAAIGLYKKFGYRKREQFGQYLDDPDDSMSVFMEKILTKAQPGENPISGNANAPPIDIPLL